MNQTPPANVVPLETPGQSNTTWLEAAGQFGAAPNSLIGLAASLSNLFSSLEILSHDPGNSTLPRGIVRNAEDIADQFNGAAARLLELQTALPEDQAEAQVLGQLQSGLDALALRLMAQVNAIYKNGCATCGRDAADFFLGQTAATIEVNALFATDLTRLRPEPAAPLPSNAVITEAMAGLGCSRAGVAQLLTNAKDQPKTAVSLPAYAAAAAASDKMTSALNRMRPI